MAKGKGKKQKKPSAYHVDSIDTTSLTLKQLQTFCEKVYQEINKTEIESRILEIERNKLKTMVEISTQELVMAKKNRRSKAFELGGSQETNTFDVMELQKQLRNVNIEQNQESVAFMASTANDLEILQRDADESRAEIERDIRQLKKIIVQLDKDRNSNVIVLMQSLEKVKSTLQTKKENDTKLQTAQYEKEMSEVAAQLKKKFTQEMIGFTEYKANTTKQYLNENHKLCVDLQHYYEKLLQRNMNIVNGLHEKYKLAKDDTKQTQSTLKTHKAIAEKGIHEMESNNEKIRELRDELAESKSNKKKLRDTKQNLISKQKKLHNHQWDNLFLEEAVRLKKKERGKVFQDKTTVFNYLKDKVMGEILIYECWTNRIITLSTQMSILVESQNRTDSLHLSMKMINAIAFAQLEEEAQEELKQKTKTKLSAHISQFQDTSLLDII